jgi:phosphoserine phosphatase
VTKFELSGAPIILATASPRVSVERVLAQCPLKFQHIITSSHSKNIKGVKKLTEIQKYLESHTSPDFIYIGDAIADLKIMKNATESIFVGKKMVYLVGRHLIQISGLERVKIERPKERGRLK